MGLFDLKMNKLFGVGTLGQGVFPRSLHRLAPTLTDVGKGSASHLTGQMFFAEFLFRLPDGMAFAAKWRQLGEGLVYGMLACPPSSVINGSCFAG